uniref:DUF2924 domain-containing protein n=1 Tax=Magnetococcus massalia (strain MO-1) TaxID=451514 RepID=A0A1S7LJ87_MAGMO|nr:conserved protein of unknown function [Candidatus Magnetococcus massalia]
MTENESVLRQVTALPDMTMSDLKAMWRDLFNQEPQHHGKHYLVRKLAYRIQELAFGGINKSTKKRLDELSGDKKPSNKVSLQPKRKENGLSPGTKLVREWKGNEYVVTVLENGFELLGQKYRSLSGVAKAITGTHWSGNAFFGLKKSEKKK